MSKSVRCYLPPPRFFWLCTSTSSTTTGTRCVFLGSARRQDPKKEEDPHLSISVSIIYLSSIDLHSTIRVAARHSLLVSLCKPARFVARTCPDNGGHCLCRAVHSSPAVRGLTSRYSDRKGLVANRKLISRCMYVCIDFVCNILYLMYVCM